MIIRSIQFKVVSLIILLLAVSVAVTLVYTVNNHREDLIDSAEKTLSVNTSVMNTVIRSIMLSGEAPLASSTVAGLKNIPGLNEVALYRTDGSSAFNDYRTLEWVNSYQDKILFEKTDRQENQMLESSSFQRVLEMKTPHINELTESQELEYFFPLLNYAECRSCHGSDHFVRGVAHFKISLKGVLAKIDSSAESYIIMFLTAGFVITLTLIVTVKRTVLTPVHSIGRVVREVGMGDLEREISLKKRDELGILAQDINGMINGLKERSRLLIENRVIEASNRENKKYLDHIQEGLVLLNRDLEITSAYSRFFTELFKNEEPEGMKLSEILYPDGVTEKREEFDFFLDMVLNNTGADMEMIQEVNPLKEAELTLGDGSVIIVDAYFARIAGDEKGVENIMVIFKDRTRSIHAEMALKEEKKRSQSELELISVMLQTGIEAYWDFVEQCQKAEQVLEDILYSEAAVTENVLRDIHTLKGIARYLGFKGVSQIIHTIESGLQEEDRNTLTRSKGDLNNEVLRMKQLYSRFQVFAGKINDGSSVLDSFIISLERMVEELAEQLYKKVKLRVVREVGEFPILSGIKGALIHLIRNALDHGIEAPDERLRLEKEEAGTISLILKEDSDNFHIFVEDDGHGLDYESIRQKALAHKLTDKEDISHGELAQFLFHPSFSSKESVSTISGRGIGLDAVKDITASFNGTIQLKNRDGWGVIFHLTFPKGGEL